MGAVKLKIDGIEVIARKGSTVLNAAKEAGIRIPTLCYHERMNPIGSCGMCVVAIDGFSEPVASCTMPVEDGMCVVTHSEKLSRARRDALAALLVHHPLDCPICDKAGECKLQDLVFEHGVTHVPMQPPTSKFTTGYSTTFIRSWPQRCVLCMRCVSACNEIQGIGAIQVTEGPEGRLISYDADKCVSCGECIQVCPVGAMVEKKSELRWRPWEARKVRTTCTYCGVGCQMLLHVKEDRIVKVSGVEDAEPNKGRLCVKGRFGFDFIYSQERLKTPLIKEGSGFREASWEEALDLVAGKFKQIIAQSGPDALAGVSCARSINEDSYQMQKLFRGVFGTNNIDHCARSCHAPTVAGLAATFGSGAMTNSFGEFHKAKMFLVIGSNMAEAHPVASSFLRNAVRNGAQLIVVDPRKQRLCDISTMHLQLKVGSDIALLNSVMNVLIAEQLYDRDFVATCTTGFEALREKVLAYAPEQACKICGIDADLIRQSARRLASVKPVMVCYTLGITEHTCGTNNVKTIANLQMLLGNMGVECAGVNPLRGQNNVQGACDMGALPNVYCGYHGVGLEASRDKFETAWGALHLSQMRGLMVPQMLEGLVTGKVRGLYIFGENLANSEPDIRKVEHELACAQFLVCQDIFQTETTRFAHVVFPSAAWSEEEGTSTNSERRVSRIRKVSTPPGLARPNWWIFKQLAKRFGHKWESESSREIWDNEISVLAPSLGGIKYYRIENDGLQWPCPSEDHPGTRFLHKDGKFTCGKGIFSPADWTPPAEVADDQYPMVLSTGRRLYHYHTRTQTGRCRGLNELLSEETADISIEDARALGIESGERVRLKSRRGEIVVKSRVTHEVPAGMVWMAFHFRETCANWLTNPALDPVTLTAEFKACAVRIEKL
ncbi:MAG: formate dehydrogenase subunit alpha [Syntrophobacteraceae bacterium]